MNTKNKEPNCVYLGKDTFFVRTQAGYRKALKQLYGTPTEMKKEYGNGGISLPYPKKYPVTIRLYTYYDGGGESIGLDSTYREEAITIVDQLKTLFKLKV